MNTDPSDETESALAVFNAFILPLSNAMYIVKSDDHLFEIHTRSGRKIKTYNHYTVGNLPSTGDKAFPYDTVKRFCRSNKELKNLLGKI